MTSIILLAGGQWGFFISLGVTQLIDGVASGIAAELGWGFKVVAFIFDLIAAGLFALIGYFASKRHAWIFVAGMIAYALDGLIFLLVRDWLAIAFHAYALFSIFGGYRACTKLSELEKESYAAGGVAPASGESYGTGTTP